MTKIALITIMVPAIKMSANFLSVPQCSSVLHGFVRLNILFLRGFSTSKGNIIPEEAEMGVMKSSVILNYP